MIGGPLTEDAEEQEDFMDQAILKPLEPFKVETETPPQENNEAELLDEVLSIDEVKNRDVSTVLNKETRTRTICPTIPNSVDHGYVQTDANEAAVRTPLCRSETSDIQFHPGTRTTSINATGGADREDEETYKRVWKMIKGN